MAFSNSNINFIRYDMDFNECIICNAHFQYEMYEFELTYLKFSWVFQSNVQESTLTREQDKPCT